MDYCLAKKVPYSEPSKIRGKNNWSIAGKITKEMESNYRQIITENQSKIKELNTLADAMQSDNYSSAVLKFRKITIK